MSKVINVFIDGSCLNGAGVAKAGPSGWATIFTIGGKVIATLGGTYRKSTSSAMEEVAFREAVKKTPELFRLGADKVVVYTDYLNTVQGIASIPGNKPINKYIDDRLIKALRGYLQEAGFTFSHSPKRGEKVTEVTSDCGRLTVKWVKAHTRGGESLENLDPIVLGNEAADKVAKDYAKQSLV